MKYNNKKKNLVYEFLPNNTALNATPTVGGVVPSHPESNEIKTGNVSLQMCRYITISPTLMPAQ